MDESIYRNIQKGIFLDKCFFKTQPDLSNLQTTCLVLSNNMINVIHTDFLPANLTIVDFSTNYIHEDGLPSIWQDSLQQIYLQNNCILQMENEQWPRNLVTLQISQNPLTQCPNNLPASLQELYMDETNITEVKQNQLPANLKSFTARRCYLNTLPKRMPNTLVKLLVNENFLASKHLPLMWGTQLKVLDLENNKLKEFPKHLPHSLEILRLSRNKLTHIPGELPEHLNYFTIAHNRIRRIEIQHRKKAIQFVFLTNNELTMSLLDVQEKEGIRWASSIIEDDNWTTVKHINASKQIQNAWRKNKFRKIIKTWRQVHRYRDELLGAAMHPSRAGRFEDISTEWSLHWGC